MLLVVTVTVSLSWPAAMVVEEVRVVVVEVDTRIVMVAVIA